MSETNFHKAFAALQHHGAAVLTATEETLRRLPITDVHTIPDVFQPRQDMHETAAHGKHLLELVRSLTAQKALKPIVVLKVTSIGWVVIDGHHRLEAYQKAGGRRTHIPVTVFRGSLDDALRFAIAENAPDKLNMTLADKREAAFRMVVVERYSQGDIAQAAGVSESTVDRMRSSLVKVRAKHPGVSWETRTWVDVKWTIRNSRENVVMWKDQRAQQIATRLTKHFQGVVTELPSVFAEGLLLHVHDLDVAEAIGKATLAGVARRRAAARGGEDF